MAPLTTTISFVHELSTPEDQLCCEQLQDPDLQMEVHLQSTRRTFFNLETSQDKPGICTKVLQEIKANVRNSGRSTPVPADAPPSIKSISIARKQLRAEQRRRLFPTIEYASRVSHFSPDSEYRDFTGFYILFWIALTIMIITTMLRNIKDTGYPMRAQIWQLFTVKVWELALADALMVGSTALSLPLHKLFRSKLGASLGLRWATGGMAIQSIYQASWFSFWVA